MDSCLMSSLVLCFAAGAGSAGGATRTNVEVIGSTRGPGFSRAEGKLAKNCPASHPFPMDGTSKCCSQVAKIADSSLDPACDGHFLRRSDPASCCGGGDFVPCPDPQGCKQNEEATYGGTAADMNKKGLECFDYELKNSWEGTHLAGSPFHADSVHECLCACEDEPDCEFYMWRLRDNSCFLRRDHTHDLVTPSEHLSGHNPTGRPECSCLEVNVDYAPGGNVAPMVPGVASPAECQRRCLREPACLFWVFVTTGHPNPSLANRCYLKGADEPKLYDQKWLIAGPRICPIVSP